MAIFPVKPPVHVASGFKPAGRPNHFGLDLVGGGAGSGVFAPEDSELAMFFGVGADGTVADNTRAAAPFDGYGPAGVLLHGRSGAFHLLAHLDPQGWDENVPNQLPISSLTNPSEKVFPPTVGRSYAEGEQVGRMPTHVGASGAHTHWEVRKEPIDNPTTRELNTVDPARWLELRGPDPATMLSVKPKKGVEVPWWVWVGGLYLLREQAMRKPEDSNVIPIAVAVFLLTR
jgi:hypothetical protein